MPIYPSADMPFKTMRDIKKKAIRYGLQRVKRLDPSSDWIAREIHPGGVDADGFHDLTLATPVLADTIASWQIDEDAMTADAYSQILASENEEIGSNQMIVLYGTFDLDPNAGEEVNFLKFRRGSSDLDVWGLEHMYGHRADDDNQDVMAFTDRIMQYLEEQNVSIEAHVQDATADKLFGLRGFMFEKRGERMSPRDWDKAKYIAPGPTDWGVDPYPEITVDELWKRKREVAHNLRQKLIDTGVVRNPEDVVVRELIIGGEDAGDVDLAYEEDVPINQNDDQVGQGYDTDAAGANITAHEFGNLLGTGGRRIPNNKAIGIYGFWDAGAVRDLTGIRFRDGSSKLQVFQPEHCYAYQNQMIQGFFARPVYYEEKEVAKIEVRHRVAGDKYVGFHGLIAERWGDTVSKE